MDAYALTNDEWTPFFEGLSGLLDNPAPLFMAVGEVARDCTLENFGASGTNRPAPWPLLSKKYAKKVKREYATLELTGELKASVQVSPPSTDSISVLADDQKASWHQLGEGRNKVRPFFPISADGQLTDYCQSKITAKLDEILREK